MTKLEAAKKFKELPEDQQKFIKDIIFTTFDACSEYCQDELKYPIAFPESVAYKAAVNEIMQHVYDNEVFDWETKTWQKL